MLVINGVKYIPWTPAKEEQLEEMVKEHSKDIFGENSLYFDVKKKVTSKTGIGAIPDGYVIIFSEPPRWCIIEGELSWHPLNEHIVTQVNKFLSGIKNPQSQKEIVDTLYNEIVSDALMKAFVEKMINSKEVHYFLSKLVSNAPMTVIIIEDIANLVEEAFENFLPHVKPKVVEFKTFERERTGITVHAHMFEPLYEPIRSFAISEQEATKIRTRLDRIVEKVRKNKRTAWMGFGQVEREKYRLVGIELARHTTKDEVVLLAYLHRPDSDIKDELYKRGYTEWFKDDVKGEYVWHSRSDKAKSHVLLWKSSEQKLDVDKLLSKLVQFTNDMSVIIR